MAVSMKDLGIDQLSADDRLALIQELWDSLSSDPEQISLTEAQRHDLQRRLAAYKANPRTGSSWEDVKARLRDGP